MDPVPRGTADWPSTRDVIDRKRWCLDDRWARSKVTRGPEPLSLLRTQKTCAIKELSLIHI